MLSAMIVSPARQNGHCISSVIQAISQKKSLRAMDSAEAKFNYRLNHNEEDMGA